MNTLRKPFMSMSSRPMNMPEIPCGKVPMEESETMK